MLKKLLASVLAVATVATCAYVPSALASADTTYKTADAVEYAVWELNNPASTPETKDLTVYIVGNEDNGTVLGADVEKFDDVKVADISTDYVKAVLADLYKDDADGAFKYEIVVSETAAAYVYVAHVTKFDAVYYYPVHKDIPDSETLLGYYADPTAAVLADVWGKVAAPKMADMIFNSWGWDANTKTVVPEYKFVSELAAWEYSYTPVTLVRAKKTSGVEAAWLVSGAYAGTTSQAADVTEVKLPNNDKANWNTYVANYVAAKQDNLTAIADTKVNSNTVVDGKVVKYEYAALRQVKNDVFAAIYNKVEDEKAADTITYSLKLTTTSSWQDVFATFEAEVETKSYTTDPAVMYAAIKASEDKAKIGDFKDCDTLAAYLLKEDAVKYAVKDVVTYSVNTDDTWNYILLQVVPAEAYTVYSFAEGDVVKETTAYLTADQIERVSYTNKDLNGELTVKDAVLAATREDLGVAENATIDGVPYVYAYAQKVNGKNVINTTYKAGDATATLADFATTTGAFDAEAYFCRDAKAGDEVTLKVSLSAAGEAKGFDVAKIAVEFNTIGATAGETYAYTGSELYKDGTAAQITLVEGTNIVTATVYYNGVKVGTFAPFYAAV